MGPVMNYSIDAIHDQYMRILRAYGARQVCSKLGVYTVPAQLNGVVLSWSAYMYVRMCLCT